MPAQFKFDENKTAAAIFYLASKHAVTELDKFKAAKLLFLADKYHVVRYARPILGDVYWAIEHGPVPSSALNLLDALVDPESKACFVGPDTLKRLSEAVEVDRSFRYPRFHATGRVDTNVLSASDIEALDHVIDLHGKQNFAELRALTHSMPAYQTAWARRPEGSAREEMNYEEFFCEDSDALAGALEEMQENLEIARALSD